MEIDWSLESKSLSMTVTWPSENWSFHQVIPSTTSNVVEIGILSVEDVGQPVETLMVGFLTVLGEDTTPTATRFTFSNQYHLLAKTTFSTSIREPAGLHPVLQLSLHDVEYPSSYNNDVCTLHAHLTLPRFIFADKYQLSDSLYLASKNLSGVRHTSDPVDLEAPEYTQTLWGSSLLLDLVSAPGQVDSWTAEVPLHLRYMRPSTDGSNRRTAELPAPILFWSCVVEPEAYDFSTNPFQGSRLARDMSFAKNTVFYYLTPSPDSLHHSYHVVTVPVLDKKYARTVDSGTTIVILIGFGWILWKLLKVYISAGYGTVKPAATSRMENGK